MSRPIIKDKRTVILSRLVNGLPIEILRRKVPAHADKVNFRKNAFPFDISRPAYKTGRTFVYLLDIKSGQLQFGKTINKVSPELVDQVLNRNLAKQLVSGLRTMNIWSILIYILMAMGIGIPFGYIIGNFLPFK